MNVTDLRGDYPFSVTMKAVIIYDHSEFVANETLLLGLVSPPVKGAAEGIVKWNVTAHELETLKQATAAETVLTEAAEAGLVVLALNKTEFVPPWLMNWVARWAACSRDADAAFLLVGGGFDARLSPLTDLELQLFVKSHASECSYEDGSLAEGSRFNEPTARSGDWVINE